MKTYDLERFVKAQKYTYPAALSEIEAGQKQSHWIWFIFPQIKGLGETKRSRDYAIEDAEEARQYLAHPILGARLREIAGALLELECNDPKYVMNSDIDALKLRSSMTLFAEVSEEGSVFHKVLDKYYGGEKDGETISRLL